MLDLQLFADTGDGGSTFPNVVGRILILPKGDYDASATYEMLDLVSYNNASWLAKKTVTGIEPSEDNTEYWQNMVSVSGLHDVAYSGDYNDLTNKPTVPTLKKIVESTTAKITTYGQMVFVVAHYIQAGAIFTQLSKNSLIPTGGIEMVCMLGTATAALGIGILTIMPSAAGCLVTVNGTTYSGTSALNLYIIGSVAYTV